MSKCVTLLLAGSLVLMSNCGIKNERKVVTPTSQHSDMPWNVPQPGEGGGALGGVLTEGR